MKYNCRIAIAGNPNSGKTTLFNALTGSRQKIGNWPGKTVEKKVGTYISNKRTYTIVDLPGTYSLSSYTTEEIITERYIIDEKPDVVVNVVDSTNLKRNLYLTLQLIELGANVILALNMTDLADKKKIKIDKDELSTLLRIPVIKISANKKIGFDELMQTIEDAKTDTKTKKKSKIIYGFELDDHLTRLKRYLQDTDLIKKDHSAHWVAIKLLEKDKSTRDNILKERLGNKIIEESDKTIRHLENVLGGDINVSIAEARYGYINGLLKGSVEYDNTRRTKTKTDIIDTFVLHKVFGIIIFFIIMWILFQATFTLANPIVRLLEEFFIYIGSTSASLLAGIKAPHWIISLISDGVIAGVGSVLVFIPNIFLLFFMIALIEDSGYMARAAFIMDKLMHKLGLHGKSFIPLILGFGCNVPAIMATRTLETKKDRILTILLTPFMSCSARLPVYILFVGAFYSNHQGLIIFSLYLLGVVLAIFSGLIFRRLFFNNLSTPFVIELPSYKFPTIQGTLIHTWERGKFFIIKAGTVILVSVIVVWFLSNFPLGVVPSSQESITGKIGTFIAPVFKPAGFGTWEASVGLLFGLVAKEAIIGTLGSIYGASEHGLAVFLQHDFTPLSAYAFMVFILIYIPCIPTIAIIRKETGSLRWTMFSVSYHIIIAWIVAVIVYQGGLLLGFI